MAQSILMDFNRQEPEWSLVFFTLISQAVAGVVFYLFLYFPPLASSFQVHAFLFLLLVVAQGFSFFHLGQKKKAYRSILGITHSWLSAEIASIGFLSTIVGLTAVLTFLEILSSSTILFFIGIETVAALVLLFAMFKVYLLPARPLWNTFYTPLNFLGSANLLGLHLFLVMTGLSYTWGIAINASMTLLVLAAIQVAYLRCFGFWPGILKFPLLSLLWLRIEDVRVIFVLRNLIGLIFPLVSLVLFGWSAFWLLVLLIPGEILGRMLFYKLSPATRQFGTLYV